MAQYAGLIGLGLAAIIGFCVGLTIMGTLSILQCLFPVLVSVGGLAACWKVNRQYHR